MATTLASGEQITVLAEVGFITNFFVLDDAEAGVLSGYTTTTTRINLVTNPNFETDTTTWAGASCTLARITTNDYIGTASLQMTSASAVDTTARTAYEPNSAVTASLSYTASAYVYNSAGNNRQHRISLRFFTSGGSLISTATGVDTTINVGADWTRLTLTATAPATTATADIVISMQINNPSLSNITLVDAVLLEQSSSALPYFDGTYADTYTGYTLTEQAWNGTANASTSTATWGLDSSYVSEYSTLSTSNALA